MICHSKSVSLLNSYLVIRRSFLPFYTETLFIKSILLNFKELYEKIINENPYTILFTGDFNAHSLNWWSQGDNTQEGIQLDNLFSDLNLTQIVSEPTHFRENCHPSCIDLIINDQPNLVLNSGVRSSLDPACKHQITFCKNQFCDSPIICIQQKGLAI